MTDMTDRAINYIKYSKSVAPQKPFFMYFAPGAAHAPHHAPKEWSHKFKGQFDQGWEKVREETYARQLKRASSRRTRSSPASGLGAAVGFAFRRSEETLPAPV